MVLVKLMGGLGNQLFQYACGRRLAHVRSTSLKLDVSDLGTPSGRVYALRPLNISAEIASDAEIWRFKTPSLIKGALKRAGIVRVAHREHNVVRERHFHFDEKILSLPDDIYLEGYWQSERYFKDVESLIRQEFSPRRDLASENVSLAAMISARNAVSVHLRRGDYVSSAKTNAVHGVCSLDYYRHAAQLIARLVGDPSFFVFSDDPEWAMGNLHLGYEVEYVTNNLGKSDFDDFRLMTLCKHHIIANSSFSWWGAWLCRNADKRVIAPAKWLSAKEHNTKDIVPASWIRL